MGKNILSSTNKCIGSILNQTMKSISYNILKKITFKYNHYKYYSKVLELGVLFQYNLNF